MVKFCFDAGHYAKYNQSPANKSYWESIRMWNLHLLVKKYIEADYECKVITTRADQAKDLALFERGAMAKGCAALISYHSNSTGNGKVNEKVDYPVAYCLVNDTTTNIDEISRELSRVLVDVVADVMKTKQPGEVKERKSETDKNKDGMLNDNYYGILNGARQVGTPALILEHSFHTNTRSTNWLLDDKNLDELARAEEKAIAEYFGVKKKTVAPAQSSTATSKLYRVQSGAFSVKENAIARYNALKKLDFDVCMVKSGGLYKVQVGAYKSHDNAQRMLEKVDAAGFDACLTTEGGTAVTVEGEKYTQEQFVRDVQKATGSKVDGIAGPETLENTVTVSKFLNHKHPVVIPIQKYLEELGYYTGDIDGNFGAKSTKAVEKLQKDIGANVDGVITRMNKTWRFLLGML